MTIEPIRKGRPGRALGVCLATALATALFAHGVAALAGVTSTTSTRYYDISGTTQPALARKLSGNPFRGEGGSAVANIRPKYSLDVQTSRTGSTCGVSAVNLNVRFTVTLPRAREGAMSASTRSAWRGFVSFARRHEQGHRSIYLQCARNFTVKAQRLSASSCGSVERQAQRLLDAEDRACNKRHAAFDRSERRRLGGLALFRATRTAGR